MKAARLHATMAGPGVAAPGVAGDVPGRGPDDLGALRSPQAIKQTFSALGQPSYRNLWLAMILQMGGMNMQIMVRGFFVFELTNSPILLGVVTAVTAVPWLALGLFGGVLADRMDKKRILQATQIISVFFTLFIAVSITTDIITWHYLLVAALGHGVVIPLLMPAHQAAVPELVGKDRLMNAIALNSMGMGVTTLAAPALAGAAIATIGVGGSYYLITGMYLGGMFFTWLLPAFGRASGAGNVSILGDLKDGLRYARAIPMFVQLLVLSLFAMVLAMPFRFTLPIFAKDDFGVGAAHLGGMMSALGVGSLLGALLIAFLGRMRGRGTLLIGCVMGSGVVLLSFSVVSALAPIYLAALGLLLIVGLFDAGRTTLTTTLLMEYAEPRYRGRIMSMLTLTFALIPIGLVPVTILADFLGAPMALSIMTLVLIFAVGIIFVTGAHLRRLQ